MIMMASKTTCFTVCTVLSSPFSCLSHCRQVPVRVEGHSLLPGLFETFKITYVLSNFQQGPPFDYVFDNRRCFNSSTASTVHFILPVSYDSMAANFSAHFALADMLGKVMKVDRSRFHLHVSVCFQISSPVVQTSLNTHHAGRTPSRHHSGIWYVTYCYFPTYKFQCLTHLTIQCDLKFSVIRRNAWPYDVS